jgi:hypothetical protein
MTVDVVDGLESVNIDERDSQHPLGPARSLQLPTDRSHTSLPTQRAGQFVDALGHKVGPRRLPVRGCGQAVPGPRRAVAPGRCAAPGSGKAVGEAPHDIDIASAHLLKFGIRRIQHVVPALGQRVATGSSDVAPVGNRVALLRRGPSVDTPSPLG